VPRFAEFVVTLHIVDHQLGGQYVLAGFAVFVCHGAPPLQRITTVDVMKNSFRPFRQIMRRLSGIGVFFIITYY
jgi:hypothetical protein